jgi:hypothetical protein
VSSGRRLVISGRRHLTTVVAVATVIYVATAAGSAYASVVASWQMNERPGATTMHDSSGSGRSGTIGSAVATGVVTDGATGYRWRSEGKDGYRPERLVTVQGTRLNPGTASFAVTIRLYTGAGDQNIIQKGQAHTRGGMFKIDMVRGFVICVFKGSERRVGIRSAQQLWDNSWHTVRCERRPRAVILTVDGGASRTNRAATGKIANTWPVSIGGKWRCDPPAVQCDYYIGRLDRAVVKKP